MTIPIGHSTGYCQYSAVNCSEVILYHHLVLFLMYGYSIRVLHRVQALVETSKFRDRRPHQNTLSIQRSYTERAYR